MKIVSITPVKQAHTDTKSIVVWTNEPLNNKCRYSFRIFEQIDSCRQWLQSQKLYNKRQAFSQLDSVQL